MNIPKHPFSIFVTTESIEKWEIYKISLDWRIPIFTCLAYVVTATLWTKYNIQNKIERNSSFIRLFTIVHNLFLCLFSFIVFINTVPLLVSRYSDTSLVSWFCDEGKEMNNSGFGFWVWIFYLSKFYELIDTLILLIKGKPSSLLQTFHHAGAIFTLWLISVTRATAGWVFIVFNSFIHTIMYFYYLLTCFGYRPSWKKLMTYMQITQFILGGPIGFIYLAIPGCISVVENKFDYLALLVGGSTYWSQVISTVITQVYVFMLVFLFVDFSAKTYNKDSQLNGKKIN